MLPVNKPDYQDSCLTLKYNWVAIVFEQGNCEQSCEHAEH